MSISDASASEGEDLAFDVSLSKPAPSTGASVVVSRAGGTGSDADLGSWSSQTVAFGAGESTKTLSVPTNDDLIDESTETVHFKLVSLIGATIKDDTGVGIIFDRPLPMVDVSNGGATEGDPATFNLNLSRPVSQLVAVDVATIDSSATAADDAGVSQTVTFAPGQTSATVSVATHDDLVVEGSEFFNVVLSQPISATIGDGQGVGSIVEDPPPVLSIEDAIASEGGELSFKIRSTLPARSGNLQAHWQIVPGTGSAADYSSSTVNPITIGGSLEATVSVDARVDSLNEPTENFTVRITAATNAAVGDGEAIGTIHNVDLPNVAVSDASVAEGSTASFTLTSSKASTKPTTITATTQSYTAAAGSDYTAVNRAFTIPAGQTTVKVAVATLKDGLNKEPTELFFVNLSNATNALILDGSGTGSIRDAQAPTIRIDDASTAEGGAGTRR